MSLTLEGVARVVAGETHIAETALRLEQGSMNVLLGPTLAGKTSLMRLMAGLDKPSAGRVLWQGEDVTGLSVKKRDVAMVYQQFINYPSLSVYENIASPLRLKKLPKAEIDRKTREAAALVKLDEAQLRKKPLALSGGQQQRCALARALAKEAGLVLLDEPLANLDYKLREELREEIPRIFAQSGAIFVYATTEPHEALLLGGKTACLWEGRVTQFGPTAEVYRKPADAVTARVFSDPPMNFIWALKDGARLRFQGGVEAPAHGAAAELPDGRYQAAFRPDHLRLERPSADAIAFSAAISVVEITGSESYVHVDAAGQRWVALEHGVTTLPAGEAREVFVAPTRLYLFSEDGALAAPASYATGG